MYIFATSDFAPGRVRVGRLNGGACGDPIPFLFVAFEAVSIYPCFPLMIFPIYYLPYCRIIRLTCDNPGRRAQDNTARPHDWRFSPRGDPHGVGERPAATYENKIAFSAASREHHHRTGRSLPLRALQMEVGRVRVVTVSPAVQHGKRSDIPAEHDAQAVFRVRTSVGSGSSYQFLIV